MEIPHWFEEGWIDTDAKALGLYIALLYSRFRSVPLDWSKNSTMESVRSEAGRVLTGKDGYEAWKSAGAFLERLYAHEYSEEDRRFRDAETVITQLESIEGNYYDRFRKACYKYFERRYIEGLRDEDKKRFKVILKGAKIRYSNTVSGSIHTEILSASDAYSLLTGKSLYNLNENERKEQESRMSNVINALIYSRILWFKEIIPAPFLEDEFVEKLAPPEEETEVEIPIRVGEEVKEVKIAIKEEGRRKYEGKTPAKEILESIVADVLKDLGLRVKTNEMLKTREGMIEVDVWGTKLVGNTRFYVYASCKNWNREVDRNVIFSEVGRISNLIQSPHLKIFIAKKLTESARETALIDGFTVIELGEKAETNNAEEIYNIVYKHLRGLFIEIAPPELQKFAKEAREISERLRTLAEEIERIR